MRINGAFGSHSKGHGGDAELLLSRSALVDVKSDRICTILPACEGNKSIAKLLFRRGASVDIFNEDSQIALLKATSQGHPFNSEAAT